MISRKLLPVFVFAVAAIAIFLHADVIAALAEDAPTGGSTFATPEPATIALLGIATLVTFARRRTR